MKNDSAQPHSQTQFLIFITLHNIIHYSENSYVSSIIDGIIALAFSFRADISFEGDWEVAVGQEVRFFNAKWK